MMAMRCFALRSLMKVAFNVKPITESIFTKRLSALRVKNTISTVLCAATVSVLYEETKQKDLESEGAEAMTYAYLMKTSSVATVDAATAFLTQTTSALLDVEDEYCEALERLLVLLELKMEVRDMSARVDAVWERVIAVRAEVNKLEEKRQDYHLILASAERSLTAAAEAAHAAGAVYAGVAASERIQSARCRVNACLARSTSLRGRLLHLESLAMQSASNEREKKEEEEEEEEVKEEEKCGLDEVDNNSIDSALS